MKLMSLIEMDGFLKGKCIPRDLKVNETNAEYLVRKFCELESKLETALRECRSAGITIDNLESKCAALAAKINVINELMEVAEQANKLVQEETEKLAHERNTLAAENAQLNEFISLECVVFGDNNNLLVAESFIPETPATDAFMDEVRAQGVEMYADNLDNVAGDAERGGFDYAVKFLRSEASSVRLFADQLRKGGDQ
ncbi:TPA: hypothetical protein J0601_000912 [Escherichia coli]|uniref:hypothetical protein n=2 Tax=Escherichia coli TaxID=562 RepID=UPI000DA55224|nr:hypothetical protein [Escherichia coli]EFA5134603.1 hypothetical protein [Escherichia coli]EFA7007314.1 hypothetical protein [Escherichia coli]EFA7709638.1 hypothetical protein [Escherichia coli]EFH4013643.1 hypothetical protein [Escherichia coli]